MALASSPLNTDYRAGSLGYDTPVFQLQTAPLPLPRSQGWATSMGNDSPVGLDDLHVNPLLLLPNHHRPPQPVVFTLFFSRVFWNRL